MRHARKVLQSGGVAEYDNLCPLTLLGQVLGIATLYASLIHTSLTGVEPVTYRLGGGRSSSEL